MFRTLTIAMLAIMFSGFVTACPDGSSPTHLDSYTADSDNVEEDDATTVQTDGTNDADFGPCTTDDDCDDDNLCTTDECEDGECAHNPTKEGWLVACDDDNPCTKNDRCQADQCEGDPKTTQDVLLESYIGLTPITQVNYMLANDIDYLLDNFWTECWESPKVVGGQCEVPFRTGAPCSNVMMIGDGEGQFATNPWWWPVWKDVFKGTCYWDKADFSDFGTMGCVATAPACSVVSDEEETHGCRVNEIFATQSYHSWLFLSDIEECFDPIEEEFVNCADAVEPTLTETPGCLALNKPKGIPCQELYYYGWIEGTCDGKGGCVLSDDFPPKTAACDGDIFDCCGSGDACQLSSYDPESGVCFALDYGYYCDDFDPETVDTCVATNWHDFEKPYETEYLGFDCYHEPIK